jgi:hypothetical protein
MHIITVGQRIILCFKTWVLYRIGRGNVVSRVLESIITIMHKIDATQILQNAHPLSFKV